MDISILVESTLDAIEEFDSDYREMSGLSEGIKMAPEYFITTSLVRHLHAEFEGQVHLLVEPSVEHILELADDNRGSRQKISMGQRYDFALIDRELDELSLFEVKHNISGPPAIEKDFNKIYSVLRRDNNVEFGIMPYTLFSSYARQNPAETLEYVEFALSGMVSRKRTELETTFANRKLYFDSDEIWMAGVVAVSLV